MLLKRFTPDLSSLLKKTVIVFRYNFGYIVVVWSMVKILMMSRNDVNLVCKYAIFVEYTKPTIMDVSLDVFQSSMQGTL